MLTDKTSSHSKPNNDQHSFTPGYGSACLKACFVIEAFWGGRLSASINKEQLKNKQNKIFANVRKKYEFPEATLQEY